MIRRDGFLPVFIVAAVLTVASPLSAQSPTQVFIEDFDIQNVRGLSSSEARTLSQALAADIQAIIARDSRHLPMTFENLESQLRKEKRAEEMACSRTDQKCILRILDNYGCEERVFGTIRQVGNQVQISISWFRGTELVPGGTGTSYADPNSKAMSEVSKEIVARMFNIPYRSPAFSRPSRAASPAPGKPRKTGRQVASAAAIAQQEILIPAGTFIMGSSNGETCEKPEHQVNLPAYYIDKYEVTQAMYGLFIRKKNKPPPSCHWDPENKPNHPVVCVTRLDAQAFCAEQGKILPTEAMWEKAARGPRPRNFPWGDELANCQRAVMDSGSPGCGTGFAMAVGKNQYGASPYGVLDMAGNVGEWVQDFYSVDYYENSPSDNPTGPVTGPLGVVRGGNWADPLPRYLRTSSRARKLPSELNRYTGFRCVRPAR
ncbi:MAG: SUMF1/EgtB/PvdO family nonheme iron enzyme [Deltaproteobacteria bacterium]|nr:SUMF1/EgtB/PvdO family nonheme iron enzyme [Deltaproteobacteria bacterium]